MAVDITEIAAPAREPKEYSRPLALWLPSEYKSADINAKKGIVTAYLTVYKWPDGRDFVDPYLDVIHDGAFSKTINDLTMARKAKNYPYLCADLWQHDRKEVIGGIRALTSDSKGVIYEAQLLMGVQRAREALELAAEKMVGSSFGYDAVRFEHKGDIRHLLEIRLHEISQVTFPANDIAPILDTKENKAKNFYIPTNFPVFPEIPNEQEYTAAVEEEVLSVKAVCGSVNFAIGERYETWDAAGAAARIKTWATDEAGAIVPEKYKQVHLCLDGKPGDAAAYKYCYCDIVANTPVVSVAAVESMADRLRVLKGLEYNALKARCALLVARINKKFSEEKQLLAPNADGLVFEWKQDFSEVWTQKLPGILMQEFFRAADTLTYVLMSNFNDDDVADKTAMIDACCTQFADCLKSWYPEYAKADDAQDALGDDDSDVNIMSSGIYAADVSEINIKRAVSQVVDEVKAGRRLSTRNRKRLQGIIDNVSSHLSELQAFIAENSGGDPGGVAPLKMDSPQYIFDITSGLEVLDTLTPASYRPSAPSRQKTNSPMFPDFPEATEVDITDLLSSIRQSMKGGTERE